MAGNFPCVNAPSGPLRGPNQDSPGVRHMGYSDGIEPLPAGADRSHDGVLFHARPRGRGALSRNGALGGRDNLCLYAAPPWESAVANKTRNESFRAGLLGPLTVKTELRTAPCPWPVGSSENDADAAGTTGNTTGSDTRALEQSDCDICGRIGRDHCKSVRRHFHSGIKRSAGPNVHVAFDHNGCDE